MNYREAKEILDDLVPLDDSFFEKIAEDIDAMEEIIQTIMEDDTLRIVETIPQKDIKNLQGRSVRLDVLCKNDENKYYNVEIQIADNDNHVKRVRYNASCITANITSTGAHFEDVPDIYMIYISKFDLFQAGRTIYHVEPVIQETGVKIDNGLHEIYVNTAVDDKTEIAELMKCFLQTKIESKRFRRFKKRVNYLKENKEGVKIMCEAIENYALKKLVDAADNLIENYNFTEEEACKVQNISVEEYRDFKKKNSILC